MSLGSRIRQNAKLTAAAISRQPAPEKPASIYYSTMCSAKHQRGACGRHCAGEGITGCTDPGRMPLQGLPGPQTWHTHAHLAPPAERVRDHELIKHRGLDDRPVDA